MICHVLNVDVDANAVCSRCDIEEEPEDEDAIMQQSVQYKRAKMKRWVAEMCLVLIVGVIWIEVVSSMWDSCSLSEHSDSPIRFGRINSIRFVKKSAIRFGRCICLINDHTPWHSPILRRCISHSAVQLILLTLHHSRHLCEVVRVTHDDGVELTFDNVVNDSSLYAYTAVMCWIESKKSIRFGKSNRIGIFFLDRNALFSVA